MSEALMPIADVKRLFGFDPQTVGSEWSLVGTDLEAEEEEAGAGPGDLMIDTMDGDTVSETAQSLPNYVGTSTDIFDDQRRFYYFRRI